MNKQEYTHLETVSALVIDNAQKILSQFKELNLTPSVNRSEMELEYKTNLFSKLLTMDKSIKTQYEFCKTDKAKADLINRTISLDGYDEVDMLLEQIEVYKLSVPYEFGYYGMTADRFLLEFNGDFAKAFNSMLRDVTETELYLEFKEIEDKINDMVGRKIFSHLSENDNLSNELRKVFNTKNSKLEVDENYVIFLLDYQKERQERIDMLVQSDLDYQKELEQAKQEKIRKAEQAKLKEEQEYKESQERINAQKAINEQEFSEFNEKVSKDLAE